MRAAVYARQSLVKKGEKSEKVERQIDRCTELIKRRKWQLVETYVDNETSATKTRGPGSDWARLLADLKAGHVDAVVSVDIDRLLRTQRDMLTLIDMKVTVVTVDGEIDLSTADGEYRAAQAANLARFEVRRKGERQKRSNEIKRDSGQILPGRRLYGFTTSKEAKVRIVPAEAAIVLEVFERVGNAETLYGIVKDFQQRDVPVGTGKVWRTGRLRDMLANDRYTSTKGVRPPKGVEPTKENRRVVPLEVARRARTVMADPTRRTTPGPTKKHLLSGVALCGLCGRRMVFTRSYHCTHPTAGHPNIKKEILEPLVRGHVIGALLLATSTDLEQVPDDGATDALVERLQANLTAQGNVTDLMVEGTLNATVARSQLVELRALELDLERQIESLRGARAGRDILSGIARDFIVGNRVSLKGAARVRHDIEGRFDALPLVQQQELMRGLVRVTVHPGRGAGRVDVTHLVVTSLNSPETEEEQLGKELMQQHGL